jgi:hypothetical protein
MLYASVLINAGPIPHAVLCVAQLDARTPVHLADAFPHVHPYPTQRVRTHTQRPLTQTRTVLSKPLSPTEDAQSSHTAHAER